MEDVDSSYGETLTLQNLPSLSWPLKCSHALAPTGPPRRSRIDRLGGTAVDERALASRARLYQVAHIGEIFKIMQETRPAANALERR